MALRDFLLTPQRFRRGNDLMIWIKKASNQIKDIRTSKDVTRMNAMENLSRAENDFAISVYMGSDGAYLQIEGISSSPRLTEIIFAV